MCTAAGAEEPETADHEERVRREVILASPLEVPSALKAVIDDTARQGELGIVAALQMGIQLCIRNVEPLFEKY